MNQQYVIFELGGQDYAIDIALVSEITEIRAITKMPKSEAYIEGILNLRGSVIPVVNLKKLLNIESSNQGNKQILVSSTNDNFAGLMIDSAKDVKNFNEDEIEPIANIVQTQKNSYRGVINVDGSLVLILDVENIVNFDMVQEELDEVV